MPTLERDTDGKIVHSRLSSSEASAMGQKRWSRAHDNKTRSLLASRGLDPDTCDEGLKALAAIATTGRSGAVSAMKYLDTLTNFYNPGQSDNIRVGNGEVCPVCGRHPNLLDRLNSDILEKLVEYARSKVESAEAENTPNPSANGDEAG